MEEKSSESQPAQDNPAQVSENMERDEEMSENSPAVGTENTESTSNAITDEKPEPSPIQSESTSGLEMISRSTASYSGIQGEAITSDAEEKKPELSVLPSESTSGIEIMSRSTTSASDILCEEVETLDTEEKPEPSPLPSEPTLEIVSVSEAQSDVSTIDTVDETDRPISNEASAAPIKSSFEKGFVAVKGFLSPPKSGKSKASRSKSMSPLKKNKSDSNNSKTASEDANVSSKGKECSKKGSGKDGVLGIFNKTWNKIKSGIKSSEKISLIPNEKIDTTEEPKQSKPSKLDDLPKQISSNPYPCLPQWTERSLSLTDRTSLGGTTETDIPSTSSDADIFPSDSSGKPSEAGDDAAEEVMSGSLVGSPDADIQKDKDLATEEETKNEVAAENSEAQSTAEDGPSNEVDAQNAENSKENQPAEKDSETKDKD